MVRIPDAGRIELRLMDGAANPYLLQAGILVAGLDGINNKRDPGKRIDFNLYTEGHQVRGVRKLPQHAGNQTGGTWYLAPDGIPSLNPLRMWPKRLRNDHLAWGDFASKLSFERTIASSETAL